MFNKMAEVRENIPLSGGHYLLSLYSPAQARATRPGQFAMLRLPNRSDILLRRPMSIYDVKPTSRQSKSPALIQILYKVVGRGTGAMAELKGGDALEVLAPLGHGYFREDYQRKLPQVDEIVHVAGGIGIAALLLAARELHKRGIRQRLFFGGRSRADLVCFKDFGGLVQKTILATEDGSRGHKGFVTVPLENHLARSKRGKVLLMVCGPWPMLEACVGLAQSYGHPCLVSMENRMGCGVGVCLGCSIGVKGEGHGAYERVCTEGPVFWSDHVRWAAGGTPEI